jgi:predicted RNase H-like HicB family nuclease
MRRYLVLFEQGEDGSWGAYSPDVEGVYALGETREETEALMREALPAHLEALREAGIDVPKPTHQVEFIAA